MGLVKRTLLGKRIGNSINTRFQDSRLGSCVCLETRERRDAQSSLLHDELFYSFDMSVSRQISLIINKLMHNEKINRHVTPFDLLKI